jgi:hypothetical protein
MKINFEEIFKIHGEIVNDTPVQRLSNEQSINMFIYLNYNARSWVKNSTGFEYLIVQRFFCYLLMPILRMNDAHKKIKNACRRVMKTSIFFQHSFLFFLGPNPKSNVLLFIKVFFHWKIWAKTNSGHQNKFVC